MTSSWRRLTFSVFGACCAAGLWVALVPASAPAAREKVPTAKAVVAPSPLTITVIAGKPSELAFEISKYSSLPTGTYTFKVTNEGVAFHDFEICSAQIPATLINSCAGPKTVILKHGQSATLTFKFSTDGVYEFLCSVPGHAAAGMKGLIGIGIPVPKEATATPADLSAAAASTTSTTSTAPAVGTTDPCPPGQTIQTAGNADGDGDETGTEHDDGDGCV